MLHGLDLFSGIGGISLALQPWVRTVCYVENEPYAQRVLQARIADGRLDDAPIWDDVRTFDPEPWRGLVDIVAGGFPCQDISTAGRGAGLAGERSGLFSEIVRIAGDLRPQLVYLENVAAITAPGRGGWDVVGALAALGYDARWGVLSAFDVGAPHLRERWWCLAYAASGAGELQPGQREDIRDEPAIHGAERGALAHAECDGSALRALKHERCAPLAETADGKGGGRDQSAIPAPGGRAALAHANAERRDRQAVHAGRGRPGKAATEPDGGGAGPDPGGAGLALGEGGEAQWAHPATAGSGFWATEPNVGRLADGVSARVDRLRGLGNSVVPACAREAFDRLLTGREG